MATVQPRRWLIPVVVAALVIGVVSGCAGGASTSPGDDAFMANVLPATCSVQAAVLGGKASVAANVFWDQVHTAAHVLAARLDKADPSTGEAFRIAKGAVERDLATLAIVPLRKDVPAFLARMREGLRTIGLPGDAPCA